MHLCNLNGRLQIVLEKVWVIALMPFSYVLKTLIPFQNENAYSKFDFPCCMLESISVHESAVLTMSERRFERY
ncbi:hypothetical protein J18TS1_22010 [Oceanobacillus oncorhynchi subsp. incaldanensis]|nr:hypothetical protein J18TS1_22010 [Oceanobacillus oncorhynchi subsp. incaldanensis]